MPTVSTVAVAAAPNCTCIEKPSCPAGSHAEPAGNCGGHGQYPYYCCKKSVTSAETTQEHAPQVASGMQMAKCEANTLWLELQMPTESVRRYMDVQLQAEKESTPRTHGAHITDRELIFDHL